MPISPLETAGAQIQPTSAAPLHTNEFFTGLWSNGNPLGPGAVPYLYQHFYSASRYDRFIAGLNVEISTRLTPMRRPGSSVYNSGNFPPIARFYEFRGFSTTDEIIRILADCDGYANQLQNPNFVNGSTGWNLGTGWSIGTGGFPTGGVGNEAVFSGPGTGAVANLQHIACTNGMVVTASCWGLGEPGASGTAMLRINFYDASNNFLGNNISAAVPNNYVWTQLFVSAAASATTAYATIDFIVQSSTSSAGRWFCWGFTGGISPGTGTVRDVTGPSTNNTLWTKDPNAGRTSFVSDGNTLYAGDGVNTHKWVTSAQSWFANTGYNPGDFIVDSNNNLQLSTGMQSANIANIEIDAYGSQFKVTLWFSSATPLNIANNIFLTLNGLTTCAFLNGTSVTVQVASELEVYWIAAGGVSVTPYSPETGTAHTNGGTTGGSQPTWQTALGAITADNVQQWVNMGSAVQSWGGSGPTNAPIVTQTAAPSIYPNWAASTWYAPLGAFIIKDSNNNLQQALSPGGQTGASGPPTWSTTTGGITSDGTVQWKNIGSAVWQASHAYNVGDTVIATFTYTVMVPQTTYQYGQVVTQNVPTLISVTDQFQCTTAGTSGAHTPSWINGVGTSTSDGGVIWKNLGPSPPGWPGTKQNISTASDVIDGNGYLEKPMRQGESGTTAPTWPTTTGATVVDNTQTWANVQAFQAASTAAWQWAYSGKNSITKEISTASPISLPFQATLGNVPVIQGQGLPNPPWDTIVLWRTQAGGSTLLYEDEFPNPGSGQTWTYTDMNPDSILDLQQPAPIAGQNGNDPPPSNFIPICFYLGRIWGFFNNQLRWTGGPDTVTGAGNSTMPAKNRFTFPSKGVTVWPTSIGLIVFTTSDIWAVLGQGTDSSPFYAINFQAGIGMASQDALTVNGSTAYAMITSHQVMSIDPGAGEVEVGFPIGDIFDDQFDPSLVYLAWHQAQSKDSGLYVADGSSSWYRMAAVAAPESGNVWSPQAVMAAPGGVKAIASVETAPGKKVLLMGPSNGGGGPILMRDTTTHADNGTAYAANAVVASVVLAQPGGTAGLQFVVTEEKKIAGATPIVVQILFDEILNGSPDVTFASFVPLRKISRDPPNLPAQKSICAQRHWAAQDANTVIKCRHYQQNLVWATENYANELFTNTVYGRLPEKARK